MNFSELAKERYSVRKFSDKPIEKKKMDMILEAAKVAPTACNSQAVKIYVIKSAEGIQKANELSKCIFGAKTVFLIAADTEREWQNPFEEGVTSGQQDASIVATHIMFQAWELGIGSCWVNLFPNSKAAEVYDLPKNIRPVLLMPVGYPDETAHPAKLHTQYRDLSELIEEL